jgi:hypothetical protein
VISTNTCARKSLNSFSGSGDGHSSVTHVHPGAMCIVVRDYGEMTKIVSDIKNSRNSEGHVILTNTCPRKSLNSF